MSGPDWDSLEAAAEGKYGLPEGVLRATRMKETSGGHDVQGKPTKYGRAQGFYQTMPDNVAKYRFNPHDPASAVDGTARLWRDNLAAAHGNVQEAARMYNGSGPEARAYAQDWMKLYSGKPQSEADDIGAMGFTAPAPDSDDDISSMGFKSPTPQSNEQPKAPPAAAQQSAGTSAPEGKADPVASALAAAQGLPSASNDGQPTLQDRTTAGVNDILKRHGGADEIKAYFDAQNVSYDPKDVDGAVAAFKDRKGYHIPITAKPEPGAADELGAGLDRGLRDVVGTVGDAGAWADKNIPGVMALDNMLGRATGVQNNAIEGAANAHAVADAYDAGPYGNSLIAGTGRLAGNLTLSGPLVMGGEAAVAPLAARALAPEAFEFAAGRGALTGGNALVRAAYRGGSLATRGATGGAEYGSFNTGSNDAGLGQNMLTGAEFGAVGAPVVGGVAALSGKAAGIGSSAIDPVRAAAARKALSMGIPVSLSQISTAPWVRRIGGMLPQIPGSGMAEFNAAQGPAFTRAVSNTFGEDSPALTAQVMENARTNVGNRIGDIASRNTITDTDALVHSLGKIESDAELSLPESDLGPVRKQITNVLGLIRDNQTLPGSTYQTLIQKGGALDNLQNNSNTALANVGSKLRDALDDAFETSVSKDDAEAFRDARLQYKNLMTLKRLAANSPDGTISPANLQNAVTTNFKGRAFSGAGDLGDLGDIGQMFLKAPTSSGTAENARALNRLSTLGHVGALTVGGLAGLHSGEVAPLTGAIVADLAGRAATVPVARLATRYLTKPARVNKLVAAALNDDDAAGTVPRLVGATIPIAGVESNRLRLATAPK